MITDFSSRHIGPDENDLRQMLEVAGASSLDKLIDETIPSSIRLEEMAEWPALGEREYLQILKNIASKNKVFKSYLGLGYYDTVVPGVIQRNVLENPGWYTAYTPYQAEISQGRMEALLNFQTMVIDLCGLEIANASLLDEATAAAEAMHMFFASRSKEATNRNANKFFVAEDCFPQTIAVLQTRSEPLGIEIIIGRAEDFNPDNSFFGAVLQYQGMNGEVHDYREWIQKAKTQEIQVAVAADLMSLVLLTPPGEWGADVVFGNSQRFGVPLGYGGPHAAFFATKEHYKRDLPGRIIGVSIDAQGNRALRMALQTREQHIKRDKATSNICTSQVLLAVMASMYAVYHGPQGLREIAGKIHSTSVRAAGILNSIGFRQLNKTYFDTLLIECNGQAESIYSSCLAKGINIRKIDENHLAISFDETTTESDFSELMHVFSSVSGKSIQTEKRNAEATVISGHMKRNSTFLLHPVFNTHHSETEMLRYIHFLEKKDLSLNQSMIALGSCTMKLNATTEMMPLSWPEWNGIHPFVPLDQAEGYMHIIRELEDFLCKITGFTAVSLQPNSGAQGEYAGLLVIRAFHHSKGQSHRNIVLIPSSAHGTNPASAVMAGLKVVVVKCDDAGNVDITDLRSKAELHKDNLSSIMITYPSTHGVYEEGIREITKIIHDCGGQVYMDGANMNAQVGLTNPANIGADVCHLNLHKTFAIPHGGGGPGMGPIGVAAHLAPFLPSHPVVKTGGQSGAVSAAPWGSASILLISYAYIRLLGSKGVTDATRYAILNANYIKARLEGHYPVLYVGSRNRVAHEMIIDCRQFKNSAGIDVVDIAKRLIDYGFHAPTMSFPVPGTMMIEPTESESKSEIDRFCEAMISIRAEIEEIEKGKADRTDNVLRNSPHTVSELTADEWKHTYPRSKAAYPLPWLREHKFWPGSARVDNAYGDRNLVCACPPVDSYEEAAI
ncbi:MAG: glycine dehydrogenase (aminomethyl-transferring) [Bacteroidetes bacterium]|nr:MAG: glycine dehydrogenase (aminomethyl-transferring) [Bacteroidota bacterium]REK05338.1 MAG: glycine dehydrogenase (aminomethyl-transferring) [Bacteroidota bacterium]REK36573.1 MAG: glycine dehydrogenase (aminomethyl-transferring) [Bacteroidota bacterium]REK51733.1 MAG: glycine dehydrogenase (aminomethyl-transferring) [Bacteroidota bacterium]